MAQDINGKGFIVGSTVTVAPVVTALIGTGNVAVVKTTDGKTCFTNNPKTAVYTVAATPSLTGTVVGFVNGGLSCVFKEADGNLVTAPNNSVTAT